MMQQSSNTNGTDKLTSLLQDMMASFSMEELNTLAFELGVDFESLPAAGKDAKARELLLSLYRTNRLPELIDAIQVQRPNIEREEITNVMQFETLPEALAFLFSEEEIKTLAFELGIDYENLPAIGKVAKAKNLVCEVKNRKRLPELIELCQEKRPYRDDWDQLTVSCPILTHLQITILGIVCVLLVLTVLYWFFWPLSMPDGFNIVVAEIAEIDEDGRIQRSDKGRDISQGLFEAIKNEVKQLPAALTIGVRPPNLVRTVKGANRDERAARASEIAARHNATILIYGIIANNDGDQQLELEFFVPDESFGYGSEVAGPDRLGKSIPLDSHLDPGEQFELNSELNGRTQALQQLVKGLANYYISRFEQAYADFDWALGISDWSEDDGKEVIHLLMGAAMVQAYNEDSSMQRLDSALFHFTKAREMNGEYARSYLGLGDVIVGYNDVIANDPDTIASQLARAEGLYLTALIMPDQPELAYIPVKASYGLGKLYLQARQKSISNWPGQQTAQELNCALEQTDEHVVAVSKCAFNQALALYNAQGQPSDLKWLMAHAHANLGILAGYSNDWSIMISESRQAIQMLEELPREVMKANQKWIACYWGQIGLAHAVLGKNDEARTAYQNAIRIGKGHVSPEKLADWEAAVSSMEKSA